MNFYDRWILPPILDLAMRHQRKVFLVADPPEFPAIELGPQALNVVGACIGQRGLNAARAEGLAVVEKLDGILRAAGGEIRRRADAHRRLFGDRGGGQRQRQRGGESSSRHKFR